MAPKFICGHLRSICETQEARQKRQRWVNFSIKFQTAEKILRLFQFELPSIRITKAESIMGSDLLNRITINADICHGKPTIRGLRYPVENMLEIMAGGMTQEEILEDYPDLEKEDLLACLEFAAKVMQVKTIHKLAS